MLQPRIVPKGLFALSRFAKTLCCVGIGAVLAVAGVCLACFRAGSPTIDYLLFPEVCASGLAAIVFCLLARGASARERIFWYLWAVGCALWVVGTVFGMLAWSRPVHEEMDFLSHAFTFLPEVAMMVALVMRPEVAHDRLRDPVVRFEAALVALWWIYLFLLFVMPWRWAVSDFGRLWISFVSLHYFQDFALVLWLVVLASHCHGPWRRIYAHMACAIALLTVTIGPLYRAFDQQHWIPVAVFDALIAAAFLWLALTPLAAGRVKRQGDLLMPMSDSETASGMGNLLVSITLLGLPLLTLWSRFFSDAPGAVSRFRLLVSFAILVAGVLLVYRWQDVADEHRENMADELKSAVCEMRRLQGQYAEAEKLASLGQLAAGAAHEINNPVAAMLGFAELLHADSSATLRIREMGAKIGNQARRIRTLVHNLLSLDNFAVLELEPVDLATLVRSAVDLCRLDIRYRYAKLTVAVEHSPLEARGDPGKLLQVFYRLLKDLSGEEGERGVEIHARLDPRSSGPIVEFIERNASLSGVPCVPHPFDAQSAQQGGGLSLGVCLAIIQEHHGTLSQEKLPDRRRLFRISLPALGPGEAAVHAPSAAATHRP